MIARLRFQLVLDLAAELRKQGSWAGETHVQKATYILQTLFGVPAGFKFVLYKHGPFSFNLRDTLNEMEADRLIDFEEQPYPYGPKIVEGRAAGRLRASTLSDRRFEREVMFVSKELGHAGVADLERLATALFVLVDPKIGPADRTTQLLHYKPHVHHTDAESAFYWLEEIRKSALAAGLEVSVSDQNTTCHQFMC